MVKIYNLSSICTTLILLGNINLYLIYFHKREWTFFSAARYAHLTLIYVAITYDTKIHVLLIEV